MSDSGIAAYGRLSREDEKDKSTPIGEKVALRKDILVTMARHHGLELCPEDITFELKSGGSLTERPGLVAILERCRRREIHTLILFDIDRLTRDIGDWKVIETALYRGRVRLITSRGVYRFEPEFDSTLLQIQAVLGERERRSFSYRRKATNVQRAKTGVRSCGTAPYGYRWDITEKVYRVAPDQYEIVEEIFRRSWTEGANAIAKDLNRRGVPPPGISKTNGAPVWLRGTVANIVKNPHYCGLPTKRSEVDREGVKVMLPRSRWTRPEEEMDYPHPIRPDDWEELIEVVASRRNGMPTRGLLSGLLYCSAGGRMHKHCRHYGCRCPALGRNHRLNHILLASTDKAVLSAVAQSINELKPSDLRTRKKPVVDVSAEAAAVRRDLREKRATMDELVNRASFYHDLPGYGPERHRATLTAIGAEVEKLAARLAVLEEKLARPTPAQTAEMVERIKDAGGAENLLSDPDVQRSIVRLVVKRVDLVATEGGRTSRLRVTFYPLPSEERTVEVGVPHPRKGVPRGSYKAD